MLIPVLLIPVGFLIMIKAADVYQFVGDIDWCEQYLGAGGTFSFIRLLGLATIILSIMWMGGGPQSFIRSNFSHLFGV
jgi:hypothetical protein